MKLLARHYRIWQFLKWHLPFMVIFHVNLPKKVSQYIENAIFGGSLRSPLYEILIREILICEVSLYDRDGVLSNIAPWHIAI